jgi:hypothetical protein
MDTIAIKVLKLILACFICIGLIYGIVLLMQKIF